MNKKNIGGVKQHHVIKELFQLLRDEEYEYIGHTCHYNYKRWAKGNTVFTDVICTENAIEIKSQRCSVFVSYNLSLSFKTANEQHRRPHENIAGVLALFNKLGIYKPQRYEMVY